MKLFPIYNFQGISFLILPCVEAQKSSKDIACVLDIGGYIFFFFSFLMWVYLSSSSYFVEKIKSLSYHCSLLFGFSVYGDIRN